MKKILLLTAAICSLTLATAQQKAPKWLSNPTAKGKTVASGLDREEATENAIGQLYDSFGMQTDTTSLRHKLLSTNPEIAGMQREAWVSAAMKTSYFKLTDSLMTDTAYWVNCSISDKDLKLFVPELLSQNLQRGSEALTTARFVQKTGDFIVAAQQYAKGLNEVLPNIHRSMISDMAGGKDLAIQLYEGYISIFDSIKVEASRTTCPMVQGEEIPLDLSFHITNAQGLDIPNLPVRAWFEERNAKVRCVNATTDHGGIATIRVTKAPEAEQSKVYLSIDEKSLFLLIPENPAYEQMKQRLSGKFDQASIELKAFNPTPTFCVSLDSLDIEHERTITDLMKGYGFILADASSADIEVTMDYQSTMPSMPEKHGDYTLATFRCQLGIKVQVRDSKLPLMQYEIKDFDLLQPAYKASEKIRERAVREMMKQVRTELPEKLGEVNYDKRKVMFK